MPLDVGTAVWNRCPDPLTVPHAPEDIAKQRIKECSAGSAGQTSDISGPESPTLAMRHVLISVLLFVAYTAAQCTSNLQCRCPPHAFSCGNQCINGRCVFDCRTVAVACVRRLIVGLRAGTWLLTSRQ